MTLKRLAVIGGAIAVVLLVAGLVLSRRALDRQARPAESDAATAAASSEPPEPPAQTQPPAETSQGLLYGRVTTVDGASHEGRLRFGGDQEAFWGNYFNGDKIKNPWLAQVPPDQAPKESSRFVIFGLEIARRDRPSRVNRRLMTPFGNIARIEADGRDVKVTLKSGSLFTVNRWGASDFDDGVRVWEGAHEPIDVDTRKIRTIEFLPTPQQAEIPYRLQGKVRTRHGEFTGFVQWDREECAGTDLLDGYTEGGHTKDAEHHVRFDTIRSIANHGRDSALVTLLDGRELVLSGTNDVNHDNRGIYVDDPRYGRVLISWDAFDRVEFGPGGSGPAYGDFPPGRPLMGTVVTRAGARLNGRLVYDLDESETVETLDSSLEGVDYTIPFGLVGSIVPRSAEGPDAGTARVTLVSGEELRLERKGDLGEQNAGVLVFVDGGQRSEYVPWADVAQIDFDRPQATFPKTVGAKP